MYIVIYYLIIFNTLLWLRIKTYIKEKLIIDKFVLFTELYCHKLYKKFKVKTQNISKY